MDIPAPRGVWKYEKVDETLLPRRVSQDIIVSSNGLSSGLDGIYVHTSTRYTYAHRVCRGKRWIAMHTSCIIISSASNPLK